METMYIAYPLLLKELLPSLSEEVSFSLPIESIMASTEVANPQEMAASIHSQFCGGYSPFVSQTLLPEVNGKDAILSFLYWNFSF